EVKRRYRGDSLILETTYVTGGGVVEVIDFMPPRGDEPDLIRLVVGREGQVRMEMELIIRFDYGSIVPWVQHIDGGIQAVAGPDTLILKTPVDLRGKNLTTTAEFTVAAGQETPLVLMWHASHLPAPGDVDARQALN